MKLIKWLFGLGGVLLVLALGVLLYLYFNLNQLVKEGIETVGPDVTKTTVAVDDVSVQLFRGKGELQDFEIGNPQGFNSEFLARWKRIGVDIDPKSVNSEVIVIRDVVIEGVEVNAEQKGTTTNLQALLKNLQQSGDSNASDSKDEPARDIRLALEKLRFADNAVNLITEKYGTYRVDLPAFSLANLGSRDQGLTPQELGEAVLQPLIKQARDAAEDRVKQLAKERLDEELDEKKAELKAKAKEKEDELKNKLEKKAGDKLKGLLNRD